MIEVRLSRTFRDWLDGLDDARAAARVVVRLRRLEQGNPGDVRPVGGGVSELRITHGPGYRLYFTRQGGEIVVLLCGGDKSTQRRDIALARRLAKDL